MKIDYLRALTDDTGIFQHAIFCIPRRSEGYTTDDNARALIATAKYYNLKRDLSLNDLLNTYLAFLKYMQKPEGNLHNYLSYDRTFLDVFGSEDSTGRTLWACGVAMNSTIPLGMKSVAKEIFDQALPWVRKSGSLRFYSACIAGLHQYHQALPNDTVKEQVEKLADHLVQCFYAQNKNNWHWFEPHLTYDNARLVQALFLSYSMIKKQEFLTVAERSMDFLIKTQILDSVFVPIGNDSWYMHGGERSFYDQQPLEASAMVEASVDGYIATKNKRYLDVANLVFGWFLGRNNRKFAMYNPDTGSCYDGLLENSVNENQGSESSISYLLARLKLEEIKQGFWHRKRI